VVLGKWPAPRLTSKLWAQGWNQIGSESAAGVKSLFFGYDSIWHTRAGRMDGMINNHDTERRVHEGAGRADNGVEPMVRKLEMAKWLRISPRTLNNYMREQRIPFHKGRKLVWFKISEVQAALFGKIEEGRARTDGKMSQETHRRGLSNYKWTD
jgi:hypothetical protein